MNMQHRFMRTFLTAHALAAALANGPVAAQTIKPQADLTVFKTAAGEITMLHSIVPMNNAHDVELLGFVKRGGTGPATHIPFEIGSDYEPYLNMRTGADCMVSSARVLRDGNRLRVLYARRKGEWLDKKPVTLEVFELTANDEDAPGTPALYFRSRKKADTKAVYCDVNDALDKEAASFTRGIK